MKIIKITTFLKALASARPHGPWPETAERNITKREQVWSLWEILSYSYDIFMMILLSDIWYFTRSEQLGLRHISLWYVPNLWWWWQLYLKSFSDMCVQEIKECVMDGMLGKKIFFPFSFLLFWSFLKFLRYTFGWSMGSASCQREAYNLSHALYAPAPELTRSSKSKLSSWQTLTTFLKKGPQ